MANKSPPIVKITARHLIVEGFKMTLESFWQIVAVAFIPFLIILAIDEFIDPTFFRENTAMMVGQKILYIYLSIFFAIMWMRFVITGERYQSIVTLALGWRELRYLVGYVIFWGLPIIILSVYFFLTFGSTSFWDIPSDSIEQLIRDFSLAFFAIALYYVLSIRWTLIFPSIAVGGSMNPAQSWRATKGHFWLLVRAFILYGIFFCIIATGLHHVFDLSGTVIGFVMIPFSALPADDGPLVSSVWAWVMVLVDLLLMFAMWAWFLTIPALCYKYFQNNA